MNVGEANHFGSCQTASKKPRSTSSQTTTLARVPFASSFFASRSGYRRAARS